MQCLRNMTLRRPLRLFPQLLCVYLCDLVSFLVRNADTLDLFFSYPPPPKKKNLALILGPIGAFKSIFFFWVISH